MVKPYAPHSPHPKQEAALRIEDPELLYGGAAGGGKTDFLLYGALQYVDVPGYRALLLRRTLADAKKPDALLSRSHEWWSGTAAHWNGDTKTWTFPSGATVSFGYLRHEKDKFNYQGPAFHYIGFDELTQFTLSQYTYLFSRLRRARGFPVPLRMRSATNPGGEGHEWVKERFVAHRVRRGESIFQSPPSTEAETLARELGEVARGAWFVQAVAQDNPGLDWAAYRTMLLLLDPVTRRQLEHGDWDVVEPGGLFASEDFRYLTPDDLESWGRLSWIRYWDMAATKEEEESRKRGDGPCWTAGSKLAAHLTEDGRHRLVVANVRRFREEPGGVEERIREVAELDGKGVSVHLEEEPGSAGKNNTANYASRVLFGWDVHGHRPTGNKRARWRPLRAAASNHLFYLLRGPWNAEFVAELVGAPNGFVDQLDSVAGGFQVLTEDGDALATARAMGKM